jgi:NADPH-dependent curcumin reductase CurA
VPSPEEGELLVGVTHISLDPAMRGWLRDVRSYVPPVGLGEVMRAGAVGTVLASRHPKFHVGQQVSGLFGVQSHAISNGKGVSAIHTDIAPPSAFLGVLGMPGLTAYFGLLDIGALKEGDTVLISGAAGAVGSVVGQLARIRGAGRVVGIAGTDAKCAHLVDDLGFDAAINYKTESVKARIKETCPQGVDVYFDNVGGDILDAALTRIARGARIVLCGAISQYNKDQMVGPKNYMALLVQRARMEGFVVFDHHKRYREAIGEMAGWIAEGKLTYRETVVDGLETFPETFKRLFTGEKLGKLVLRV